MFTPDSARFALVALLALATASTAPACGRRRYNADARAGSVAAAADPGAGASGALAARLTRGATYGEGPEAQEIARALRDGVLEPGDAIAVRVIDGAPRRVVVLVAYTARGVEGLRDLGAAERRRHLDQFLEELDAAFDGRGDHVAVAIRGRVFFGALVTRAPGEPARYATGAVVDTAPLDAMLAAPAGPPAPLPQLAPGATVTGTLAPEPAPAPRYALTLARPERLTFTVRAPGVSEDDAPAVLVCRGQVRLHRCVEHNATIEPDENDDDGAYVLPAGTYTVFVSNEDRARPLAYTLSVARPRGGARRGG